MSREVENAKQRYGSLFYVVRDVLDRHDPMHIGYTADEYEPEVVEILPGLNAASSQEQLLDHVFGVFSRMFAPAPVPPRETFHAIAREIWELR